MKFQVTSGDAFQQTSDCLVVFAAQDGKHGFRLFAKGKELDRKFASLVTLVAQKEDFEAKVGNILSFHIGKEYNAVQILLSGVGDPKTLTMKEWLDVTSTIGKTAKKIHSTDVTVILEDDITNRLTEEAAGEGIVEGMILGTYRFSRYKKEEKKEHLIDAVTIVTHGKNDALDRGIRKGELFSEAAVLARDLVNEPSSVTTPAFLASFAMSLAKKDNSVRVDILEKKDMEKLGMGGILGIAKGSSEEPKLITLRYTPNHTPASKKKTVVLVGKGVTFDSGGLSLKSDKSMETMKIDMAGAAAILGMFSVLSRLSVDMDIVGVIPAVENMPSGSAIKPGDVVRSYTGKTIEIISTDAEGRVILADALSWAGETIKPDIMIDLATLTGACMIALGEDIAGLFATDTHLGMSLRKAGEESGEALWELPLPASYTELLKSDVADLRNMARNRYAGALTAGLFLQAFVPDGTPWAHLDIAGPAYAEKDTALSPVGGTGYGVRLLLHYLTPAPERSNR